MRADFITNFNYDGDYIGNNNWNNLYNYYENAYVYYKVSETTTHYFIEYDFFHPRDDGPISLDAHENDMEGCVMAIRKDGSTYGAFHILETFSHNQWYQYTNDPNVTTGSNNVDGGVLFNGSHPKVFIQANGYSPTNGHGVLGYDGSGAPGGDGIIYDYTGNAQYPTNATGNYVYHYGYAFIEWNNLWQRRYDVGGAGHTFESFGTFDGDDYMDDSANTPWAWDDSDDGPCMQGMNWSDPALMFDVHLNSLGNFSHSYVSNPYFSHKIVLVNAQSMSDMDPFGGAADIYIKAYVNGQGQTDARNWKYDNIPKYVTKNIIFGYDSAEFGNNFSSQFNTVYVCKPHNVAVEIHAYDSDGTSGDDDMGYLSAVIAPNSTQTWSNAVTSNGKAKISAIVYTQPD